MVILRTLGLCLCLLAPSLRGEEILLESDKGSAFTARLVACDGVMLDVIRTSDQKPFSIPLDTLSAKSRADIKAWQDKGGGLREEYSIEVNTGKNRKTTKEQDLGNKRLNLDPVVTIANTHTKVATREAKVTVLFLGHPIVEPSALHVFSNETFDLPSLQAGASRAIPVGVISVAYEDRKSNKIGSIRFGSRYAGYVVVIHDGGRNMFACKSVPAALFQGKEIGCLSLKPGKDYDRNLKQLFLRQDSP